jgi:hypothetical protein
VPRARRLGQNHALDVADISNGDFPELPRCNNDKSLFGMPSSWTQGCLCGSGAPAAIKRTQSNLSERKPMDCLTRLGYDIEIKVRPAKAEVGHLMFAAA